MVAASQRRALFLPRGSACPADGGEVSQKNARRAAAPWSRPETLRAKEEGTNNKLIIQEANNHRERLPLTQYVTFNKRPERVQNGCPKTTPHLP
ncbi:unnamed protein product [Pipistrellus nathusii]|uniref:Uncharacterized protein n=1 Tax=Pipistrellus nathusii TaxID=59473 RepID=A0ABP0AJ06_PIPNA